MRQRLGEKESQEKKGVAWQCYEKDHREWERDFERDRKAWGKMDWFIIAGLALALVLLLSCYRTTGSAPLAIPPAVPDPSVRCLGYAQWSDAWCECVWAADSTYFERGE